MGQREDMDARARRRVADQVRNAVISGSIAPVMAAHAGEPERAAGLTLESAAAASAVVLASDLRAPANGHEPTTIIRDEASALTEEDWERIGHANADESPFRVPSGAVSPNRQGWRARLANVERMLAVADRWFTAETLTDYRVERGRGCLDDALAEVRAMIDGDE